MRGKRSRRQDAYIMGASPNFHIFLMRMKLLEGGRRGEMHANFSCIRCNDKTVMFKSQ